jgi:hypothetical protein
MPRRPPLRGLILRTGCPAVLNRLVPRDRVSLTKPSASNPIIQPVQPAAASAPTNAPQPSKQARFGSSPRRVAQWVHVLQHFATFCDGFPGTTAAGENYTRLQNSDPRAHLYFACYLQAGQCL